MNVHLKSSPYKGKLVVFEGTDGAGKTTLINYAQSYLINNFGSDKVICLKQPTDLSRKTKLFQKMMYSADNRDICYKAVQLLTLSDRVQHDYEIIRPALREGKIVICDRYLYTSIANMLARGYRREKWFFNAARSIVRPNCIFLATCPADQAIDRIKKRPSEMNRFFDEILLKKVHDEFLRMSKFYRFHVIDTSGSAENAFQRVTDILEKNLCLKRI